MTRNHLPYGHQSVDDADIKAVAEVLCSDWLTTGPKVGQFESAVAEFCGVDNGVAVSSGTAALHCAMHAIGIKQGDEVIVPAITFVATANCVVYQGGTPVFADVDAGTLLVNPDEVERKITAKTRAIIAVDYAGQPCDYGALRDLAIRHNLKLVADACHSLGATDNGTKVGGLADLTVLSFHPVKQITTGEGGMVVGGDAGDAERMRRFRNHGIATDQRQREKAGTWKYEMVELGFNYRITDFQCALGISQLAKLPGWLEQRRSLALSYDRMLHDCPEATPLSARAGSTHAYHLYPVLLAPKHDRSKVFEKMRASGIGVNVHYLPVYLHPYYQNRFQDQQGICPVAEEAYERILSLPIWPGMDDGDVERVVRELKGALIS